MISIERILKKSWHILWSYRVLWIFGLLLSLTLGGTSGNNLRYTLGNRNNDNNNNQQQPGRFDSWNEEFNDWAERDLEPLFEQPAEHLDTILWIIAGGVVFVLLVSLVVSLVRYPAETAVLRMVDAYDQDGTRLGFRAGWKLGWNRRAFRLWVIDLIYSLPAFIFLGFMLLAGMVIFFAFISGPVERGAFAIIAMFGLFVLGLLAIFPVAVFFGILRNLFARAAALDDRGVIDAFSSGWSLFVRQWKNVGLMWLTMLAVGIVFGLVSIPVFFLLIPTYILMMIPAAAVALVPGLLAWGIASLFTSGPLVWLIAGLAAAPFFIVIMLLPLFLFGGWYRIFDASAWTLTYREIRALSAPEQ